MLLCVFYVYEFVCFLYACTSLCVLCVCWYVFVCLCLSRSHDCGHWCMHFVCVYLTPFLTGFQRIGNRCSQTRMRNTLSCVHRAWAYLECWKWLSQQACEKLSLCACVCAFSVRVLVLFMRNTFSSELIRNAQNGYLSRHAHNACASVCLWVCAVCMLIYYCVCLYMFVWLCVYARVIVCIWVCVWWLCTLQLR